MEKILKAAANRRRLKILSYLKNHRKSSVGELAEEIKLSFKSTSRHLAILRPLSGELSPTASRSPAGIIGMVTVRVMSEKKERCASIWSRWPFTRFSMEGL